MVISKRVGWAVMVVALGGAFAIPATAVAEHAASGPHVVAGHGADDPSHPNVVVIETDDERYDEMQYLPQTRALLQGTTFTNSFVSTSLCCPSRAAFLSGQYAQNNKVTDNNEGARFVNTDTLATELQNGGYFTSIIGKYLNGYSCSRKRPPGWSHWQALCSSIYSMYGYTIDDNGVNIKYPKTGGPQNYQTDEIASRAASTIDEGVASGKPFFIWLTPTAPHGGPGVRAAPRYLNALSNYKLPEGPSFNEADVSDKPAWVRALTPFTKGQIATIQSGERTRLRMLLAVDDLVAKVVGELQAQGVSGNTDIIFTSDNGFMRGEHRVPNGKEILFAESLRVPLLISGPGIPVQNDPAPVQNTDLAPTILNLANVPAPARGFDGVSILPAISDPTLLAHRVILHRQVGDISSPAHPTGFGVQADQFIFDNLVTGERELYDHRYDPYELNNVVNDPRYAPVVAQMQALLNQLETCSGASCHVDRPDLPPTASYVATCPAKSTACSFNATASDIDGSVASYSWDFGDGNSATGASANHTYTTPGTYSVTLTVTDDRGAQTFVQQSVTTGTPNLPPVPSFTYSATNTVVNFDATGSTDPDGTIASYSWDFGDGNTATGATPQHDFVNTGSYLVTLTVTDNDGASSSTSQLVSVSTPNIPPVAMFTISQTGNFVSLDATASYDPDGTIVQYTWDFGDGTDPDSGDGGTNSGSVTSHTYVGTGTRTITLTVTDNRGGTATASQTVSF